MGNIVVGEYYKSKEERCIIKIDTIVDYFGEKWCETTLFKVEGISHIKFPMESYFAQSLEKIDNFAAELFKFFNLENIKSDKEEKVPNKYVGKYFKDVSSNTYIYIIDFDDKIGIGNKNSFEYYYYPIKSLNDIMTAETIKDLGLSNYKTVRIICQDTLDKMVEVSRNDVINYLLCTEVAELEKKLQDKCEEKTYTSEDIVNACAKIIEKTDCFGTGIADAIDSICYEIISELERGGDE